MNLNLETTPFSRRGSYMAISYLPENFRGGNNREGIYWRTVHDGSPSDLIARLTPMLDGKEVPYRYAATEAELVISCGENQSGEISICFGNEHFLLIRGRGSRLSLRLEGIGNGDKYTLVNRTRHAGKDCFVLNCFKNSLRCFTFAAAGTICALQDWDGETSSHCSVDLCPENDCFEVSIQEDDGGLSAELQNFQYEACRQSAERNFQAFYRSLPTVPERYERTREAAAYVIWSCFVKKSGFLQRDAVLMSKNWMNRVWSWDQCFNALALAWGSPAEAWDQFMLPFDAQCENGMLPDTVSDLGKTTSFCKPPIHGWTLLRLMKIMKISRGQLETIYPKLAAWTNWWFNFRDSDGDGICEYFHGNESGWDNSTAFLRIPPLETPDLSSFLVIQMDALAEVVARLGRPAEAENWKERADRTLRDMLNSLFSDGLPTVRSPFDRKTVKTRSLIRFLPLLLGDRLPQKIRKSMLRLLREEKLYTEHGFATEAVDSPYYQADGYWRGPIWAPSSLLLVDALKQCGEDAWAKQAAERYCNMVQKEGCAENFNALSGTGLRDRAHTWTASVFLLLAHGLD